MNVGQVERMMKHYDIKKTASDQTCAAAAGPHLDPRQTTEPS